MPRVPARSYPPRTYLGTEVRQDVKDDFKRYADEFGVSLQYIVALCVQKALPEVLATLRSGEYPDNTLCRSAVLKTREPKAPKVKMFSRQDPPPLAELLEHGEFSLPQPPEEPPVSAASESEAASSAPSPGPDLSETVLAAPVEPQPEPAPTPEPVVRKRRRG